METKHVYVVGIQEGGNCVLTRGRFYTDRSEAEKEVARDRESGITYTKIFTLYRHDIA